MITWFTILQIESDISYIQCTCIRLWYHLSYPLAPDKPVCCFWFNISKTVMWWRTSAISPIVTTMPKPLIDFPLVRSSCISVAVVGAGIGGTATAHFLRQHFGPEVRIDVFEKGTVGGRLATVTVNHHDYESGGSIIHSLNLHMQNFVKQIGTFMYVFVNVIGCVVRSTYFCVLNQERGNHFWFIKSSEQREFTDIVLLWVIVQSIFLFPVPHEYYTNFQND